MAENVEAGAEDVVVGLQQEARRLGIGRRRAVRLVERGLVKARLVATVYLVKPGALDRFAERREVGAMAAG